MLSGIYLLGRDCSSLCDAGEFCLARGSVVNKHCLRAITKNFESCWQMVVIKLLLYKIKGDHRNNVIKL